MKHSFSITTLPGIMLCSVVLLIAMAGCKNKAARAEEQQGPATQAVDPITTTTPQEERAAEENLKPFKGVWTFKQEADEESGMSFGRYEMILAIDLYEKSVYNGFGWNHGGFFVANDRHEGDCEIVSCKVNGNEADIEYESLSGAVISAKLAYDPQSRSMTLRNGEVTDAADVEQAMILNFNILRGETKLTFKSDAVVRQGTVNLEGTLSKTNIKMALNNPDPDAKVRGHYCYLKYNTPILLEGRVDKNVFTLDEYNNGVVTGTFTITPNGQGEWEGTWSNGKKTLPVKLHTL